MQPQKQNYLSVTYQFSKGLHFKWNFRDPFQYTNFFHHLFVIRSHQKDILSLFLNSYYKKLKSGDLITAIYYDQNKLQTKKMKWIEKTQITTFEFSSLIKRISGKPLTNEIKEELTHIAVQETQSQTEHYVVNFVMQDNLILQEDQLIKMIEEGRKEGGLNHICTFFGKFRNNTISFTTGINFFSLDADELHSLLQFYSVHINSANFKKAKISLECTDGQLLSYNGTVWKNVDFNKLEKTFYGPSISYTEDELHFHLNQLSAGHQFELIISLEIKLFNGQSLKNQKKIKLCVPPQKYLDKSINMAMYQSHVSMQGLLISNSPYSTFSIAKLIKNQNDNWR